MKLPLLWLCFVCAICCSNALKVLLLFPLPMRSLNILGVGFMRHLTKAGHEVTFATVYPTKNNANKNLRQIDISGNEKMMQEDHTVNIGYMMENHEHINDIAYLHSFAMFAAELTFQNENFRKLLEDPKEQFDVVISDLFDATIYSGLAAMYKCPMIWSYSMGAHWNILRLIDEPTNPAYTTDYLSLNTVPLSFTQRVHELWTQIEKEVADRFTLREKEKALYEKYFTPLFTKRDEPLPDFYELVYNASLIISNEHNAVAQPKTPQNFKLIGGYHIEHPPKALPQDLQSLMDNAKHGVIYFSMGSTWKSAGIPKPVIDGILKVFSNLKETVIWKYEDILPNLPKNVHILKWAPQTSILAHPNCVCFITHGGLLSSTEAVHFGVPTIGIPIVFDQFVNTNKAVAQGYALNVNLNYNLPSNLEKAIRLMLNDPKYKIRIKQLSAVYHDRLVPPGEELVYWVEHVVRTGGAAHLRSPALPLPFYQRLFLDLLAVILIAILLVWFILKSMISLTAKKQKKEDGKKRN